MIADGLTKSLSPSKIPLVPQSANEHPRYFTSTCETIEELLPPSVRSEGGEEAAVYFFKSGSYRVDDTVKYNVLSSA